MTNAHIYARVLYGLSKRYVKHSRTYIYLHTHITHLSSFPIASEREIRISHLNEVAKSAARRTVHAYSRDWFAPLYICTHVTLDKNLHHTRILPRNSHNNIPLIPSTVDRVIHGGGI